MAVGLSTLVINLNLTSVAQAEALIAALELYVDMETDRSKDAEAAGFDKQAKERLQQARYLLQVLSGRSS